MKNVLAILCLCLLLPMLSIAHPGHGSDEGFSIIHYMLEPIHLLVSLIVIAATVYAIIAMNRNRKEQEQ